MNVFERSGEIVEMSAVSDLVNGWPGGIIQVGRYGVNVSPIYLVNQLTTNIVGTIVWLQPLMVQHSTRQGRPKRSISDVVVNRGGSRISKAVNTHRTAAITTTINVNGAT